MLVIRLGFVPGLFTVGHIGNTHCRVWYSGHDKERDMVHKYQSFSFVITKSL